MRKRFIIFNMLLMAATAQISASAADDSPAPEKEVEKTVARLEKDSVAVSKKIAKLRKDLAELKTSRQAEEYFSLIEEREELRRKIENDSVTILQLNEELSKLDVRIGSVSREQEALEQVKEKVVTDLIAANEDYLRKPLLELDSEKLKSIRGECSPYSADDEMKAFILVIDRTAVDKRAAEEAVAVLNSRFDAAKVETAMKNVEAAIQRSPERGKELDNLNLMLGNYAEGVETLKYYVNELNKNRTGVDYLWDYFAGDNKSILRKNDMEAKMERMMTVPYLKKMYDNFISSINKNPNGHSDSEKEILSL